MWQMALKPGTYWFLYFSRQMETNKKDKINYVPVQGSNRSQSHWIKLETSTDSPFTHCALTYVRATKKIFDNFIFKTNQNISLLCLFICLY